MKWYETDRVRQERDLTRNSHMAQRNHRVSALQLTASRAGDVEWVRRWRDEVEALKDPGADYDYRPDWAEPEK